MALQFYKLKVKRLVRLSKDTTSVVFDVPAELEEEFNYKPGQYITLKVPGFPELESRRAYSICSSPEMKEELSIAVKNSGRVSEYINNELREGDELEVLPPFGNFTIEFHSANKRHYFLVGAGSGITPLVSIIKTVLHAEPESKITLLYGNRNEESIIFKKDLDIIKDLFGSRIRITHILSRPSENWNGMKGRIDEVILKSEFNKYVKVSDDIEAFICGPTGMMLTTINTLTELKVPSNKIHVEYFLSKAEATATSGEATKDEEKIKERKVRIRLYGEEKIITVQPDDTILIGAVNEHLDPPFSCQIGACSTCRAMLISGEVRMDARDALTDGEIKEGYILTCQAHPLTDDVFVDYDY